MLHVCVQKFDATGNFENFWELNRAGRVDDDMTGAETASARRGQGVHLGRPPPRELKVQGDKCHDSDGTPRRRSCWPAVDPSWLVELMILRIL